MGQLFIYFGLIIGIAIIAFRLLAKLGEIAFSSKKINSFVANDDSINMPEVSPEGRDFEVVGARQSNYVNIIFKKIPSLITMWSFGIVLSMLFGGYMATANIERLAAAGSALQAGNTGLALSYIGPLAKSVLKDQYRISSGNHPLLEKYGLEKFKYLGIDKDHHIAMMKNFVTAGDVDRDLLPDNPDFNKILTGVQATEADEICSILSDSDDVKLSLINQADWKFSFSHILAKRNINRENDSVEWFSDKSQVDNDNFMLNTKNNKEFNEKLRDGSSFRGGSSDGVYFDEDDIHDIFPVSFRCVAKWPKGEDE